MRIRSLPHFSHKAIGKTTHKKGMTYSHVNYITRDDACSKTLAGNMPADREGARPYFEREANKEGVAANARIADTFIIALPLELTREQRFEAIERFMDKIGHGRIAWIAAFHDKGKDEHNPHCHLIFRDADIETGRKVVGTTTSAGDVKEAKERGWKVPPRMTTKDLRNAWCEHLNSEMERHGLDVRFDQRKLKERGIDREPEIHVGPKASSMAKKDRDFFSQDRRRGDHTNVYTLLDTGSRAEHNRQIAERNRKRGGKSGFVGDPREAHEKQALRDAQALARRAMYAEQTKDRAALRAVQDEQKLAHQRWARAHYAKAREAAFNEVKQQNAQAWSDIRKIEDSRARDAAAAALQKQQKEDYAKASTSHVERARPDKDQAWQQLKITQDIERRDLKAQHAAEATALARQQNAERQALHERWQDFYRQKQTQGIEKSLQSNQSMASVQTVAVKMIALHAKSKRSLEAGERTHVMTPHDVAVRLSALAKGEDTLRSSIRYKLNKVREGNQGKAAGRLIGTNVRARAAADDGQQKAIQQAARTGLQISDADRASASPATRAAIASRERVAQKRRSADLIQQLQQQRSDKDRSGGRSGR